MGFEDNKFVRLLAISVIAAGGLSFFFALATCNDNHKKKSLKHDTQTVSVVFHKQNRVSAVRGSTQVITGIHKDGHAEIFKGDRVLILDKYFDVKSLVLDVPYTCDVVKGAADAPRQIISCKADINDPGYLHPAR